MNCLPGMSLKLKPIFQYTLLPQRPVFCMCLNMIRRCQGWGLQLRHYCKNLLLHYNYLSNSRHLTRKILLDLRTPEMMWGWE